MIALLLCGLALGGPVAEGAAAWDRGAAQEALGTWTAALEQGDPSGVLLYDLGVASYRLGEMPRAVGYWRAASRLRPRDPRLVHNLARARNEVEGAPPPVGWQRRWMALVTPGELGLAGLLLLAVALGGLAWRRRQGARGRAWIAFALAAMVPTAIAWSGARAVVRQPVVVVLEDTAVRDAATAEAEIGFHLAPGAEVRIEQGLGPFVLVRTGDDRRGWIPRRTVFHVGPPSPAPGS